MKCNIKGKNLISMAKLVISVNSIDYKDITFWGQKISCGNMSHMRTLMWRQIYLDVIVKIENFLLPAGSVNDKNLYSSNEKTHNDLLL